MHSFVHLLSTQYTAGTAVPATRLLPRPTITHTPGPGTHHSTTDQRVDEEEETASFAPRHAHAAARLAPSTRSWICHAAAASSSALKSNLNLPFFPAAPPTPEPVSSPHRTATQLVERLAAISVIMFFAKPGMNRGSCESVE